MKCRMCHGRAVIKLPAHNLNLCENCFVTFLQRRVRRTIGSLRLLSPGEKVLVAVSGGKDSLSLWDLLLELGYQAEGLYIDLGIGEYSQKSEEKAVSFAQRKGARLHIQRVKDYFGGLAIPEIARRAKRTSCSVCGLVKRYLMNQSGRCFDVIATGHNLDDEVSFLLGNLLNWQTDALARQAPSLPDRESLRRKVKPLVLCSEREMAAYALIRGIDYILDECPYSQGSTSLLYKSALNRLEQGSPGTKLRFYQGFLKSRLAFVGEEEPELQPCENCGYLTTTQICSFCRLQQRVLERV